MEMIVKKTLQLVCLSHPCSSFSLAPWAPWYYFFCRLEAPSKISEEVSKAETATEVRDVPGIFSLSCMGVVR